MLHLGKCVSNLQVAGVLSKSLKMTRKQMIKRNAFLYICCVHAGCSAPVSLQPFCAHTTSTASLKSVP